MNDSVLAAVRGTEARDVVAVAGVIAKIYGRDLVVAGICELPTGVLPQREEHALRERVRTDLDGFGSAAPAGVSVQRIVQDDGSPVTGFHDVVDAQDPAVAVVGPDYLCALTRGVRGDPGLGLTRDVSCALVVAPHGYARASGDGSIPRTIGVGWEPTDEAKTAVRSAIELARHVDGTVRLIQVIPDDRGPAAADPGGTRDAGGEDRLARRHHAARHDLEAIAEALHAPVPVEVQVLHGDPAHVLAGASSGVDVLVLGSRGYGAPGRTVLGNVSAALLPRAACPVVVLPRSLVNDPLDRLPDGTS